MVRSARACLILLLASATFGQGQESLCAIHIEVPDYSPVARTARLQGKVSVAATIDAEGHVIRADPSGAATLLGREAAKNLERWMFSRPPHAPHTATIFYEYKLEGPEIYDAPPPKVSFDLPDHVTIVTQPPTVEQ